MNFLQQRQNLITGKQFDGRSSCFADLQCLTTARRWTDLIKAYRRHRHILRLSPGAHHMLKAAYQVLGDKKAAEREERRAQYLLRQLLKAGDGSVRKPYLISIMSDEQDILRHLKAEALNQKAIRHNGKILHTMLFVDETEFHFDVSHLTKFMRFNTDQ